MRNVKSVKHNISQKVIVIRNIWKHFRKIQTHRKWVRYYCFKCGIFWQGIKHDLSKYSPTEFFESVKYYQGTSSPINAAKADKGYSDAWFHHKGRNKHHYEYWMDNFDDGGQNIIMPFKYWVELICDYLGASHAYNNNDFSYYNEFKWWEEKSKHCAMNPALIKATTAVFEALMRQENAYYLDFYYHPDKLLSKAWLKQYYDKYVNL